MAKRTTVINQFNGGIDREEKGSPPIWVPRMEKIREADLVPDMMGVLPIGEAGRFLRSRVPTFPEKIGAIWYNLTTPVLNIWDGLTRSPATDSNVNVYVGTFAMNTSTGNQSITDPGFTPKYVIFLGTTDTGNIASVTDDWNMCVGVGVDSSNRLVVSQNADHGASGGSNFARALNYVSKCILLATPGTATILAAADYVSNDANGFTINVTTAPASAYRIGYLAIGGDDVTDAAIGNFQSDAAADADTSVTGVGFQPDNLGLFGIHDDTAPDNNDVRGVLGLGWTHGTKAGDYGMGQMIYRTSGSKSDTQISGPTGANDCYRTTNPHNLITGASALLAYEHKSFDSDGFTLNKNSDNEGASGGRQFYIDYLATKGGNYKTGLITLNTATGNQSETGLGFTPKAVMFFSNFQYSSGSIQDGKQSFGFTDGTRQFCIGGRGTDNVDPTVFKRWQRDDAIIRKVGTGGSVETSCSHVSLDADGFTFSVDTAPSNGEKVGYIAFG